MIVYRVTRLVKMCGNRSRADELIVILYGAAIFSKAFVELAFGLPNVLFFTFFYMIGNCSRFSFSAQVLTEPFLASALERL